MAKTPSGLDLVLVEDDGLGKIVVDMEAFFEFSFWLAEELEDLLALWAHTAPATAPRSGWENAAR